MPRTGIVKWRAETSEIAQAERSVVFRVNALKGRCRQVTNKVW